MAGKQRGSRSVRVRSGRWLAVILVASFALAFVSAWELQVRLDRVPSAMAARDDCVRAGAALPFWTPAGYACLRLTSPLFRLLDDWAALLLLFGMPLAVLRSYRLAQAGARPGAPWLLRDTTGFCLGLLPWAAAFALAAAHATWPLLLLPAGLGGSWWLSGWLARRRVQGAVRTAAVPRRTAAAPRPAAAARPSAGRALVPVPFAPVLRTIPVPPGPLLVKDEDGPPPPLWERLLGGGPERGLGEVKELQLGYGFELSYPVTVLEYLLCCWHGGADSSGQGGGTRSHHLRKVTAAHVGRMLFSWPLYRLGCFRLERALRPYYRAGRRLRRRESWLFADAALAEMAYARGQALNRVAAEHPWLREPVVNVTRGDAYRYCCWLAAQADVPCRLPTELEFLRAAYYLERECGWQLLPVFQRNWYWTADWYAALPSHAAARTLVRYPWRTTRRPFAALKSVHLSPYERGAVVPWLRAANHGLLYVCERPAAGRALPDLTAAAPAGAERAGGAGTVVTIGRAK